MSLAAETTESLAYFPGPRFVQLTGHEHLTASLKPNVRFGVSAVKATRNPFPLQYVCLDNATSCHFVLEDILQWCLA